ncbi:hypothetical protein HQO27_14430 [Rhodococcus fascians]|nr:hypothetical protein [Rhodococcus fascians]MBY4431965.1 hypothetical protein [Rhodococcus fascians]
MITSKYRSLAAGAMLTAVMATGLATAAAAPASAGPTHGWPSSHPEISVSAQTGVGTRAYVVRNQGDTVVPAGTQFSYHSAGLLSVGLFGDQSIGQDWNIQALGSGYDSNVFLKEALQPGQSVSFALSKVEVSAFTQSTFELTDPNVARIDTNLQNNKAGIRCTAVFFGLPACSATF